MRCDSGNLWKGIFAQNAGELSTPVVSALKQGASFDVMLQADAFFYWVFVQMASVVVIIAIHMLTFAPVFATFMFNVAVDKSSASCTTCAICLDTKHAKPNSETMLKTICCHFYHRTCLYEWLKLNPNCPECRRDLRVLHWRWAVYQACAYACRIFEQYGNRYIL